MTTRLAFPALLLLALVPLAAQDKPKFELPKPNPDGTVTVFNGKDLTGWDGDPEIWKVEDGQIVGKTATGIKKNNFLKSQFEVADFRLVVQVKLTPNGANSGIQFRSQPWKGHEMKGYQADMGKGWWGKLYEESGRALLVKEGGDQFVKADDWNTYEIVAVGHHVLAAINGHKVIDFQDEKGDLKGIFGLQVHSGGPTDVRFKDLQLTLNPKAELVTLQK